MEQLYKKALMAMMAIIMAVSFSACSDDDDDTKPVNPTGNNIVGTWVKITDADDHSVTTLVFNDNGTGMYTYVDEKGTNTTTSSYEWTLTEDSNHKLNLKIVSKSYCPVAGTYTDVTVTKSMLQLGYDKYERK